VERLIDRNDTALILLVVLVALPLLVWQFAVAVRRFHDFSLSGWYSLLIVLPGIQIVLLFIPGSKGANKYGKQPVQQLDVTSLLVDPRVKD
jgi:uncharacterized membrane protein YhaH (DUF805 family)